MGWKFKLIPIILFLLFSTIANASSIGVSPGDVLSFNKMVRGGYAQNTITISTADEENISAKISTSGDIKDWLSFEPNASLTLNRNNPLQIKVIVQPPSDVQNGNYEGYINVRAQGLAPAQGEISSTVSAGVTLKTTVQIIGEQINSYTVSGISVKDIEEGLPIEVSMRIDNTGNVKATPKIHVDILKDNSSVLKSADKETDVLPTTSKEFKISISLEGFSIGEYSARIKVFKDGAVLKEETLSFNILERGSLRIKGELKQISNKLWAAVGETIKISAIFSNTGESTTLARFKGEISLGDEIVKTLESDELEVMPKNDVELVTYFKPEKDGRHVIRGYVLYSKKATETKDSILNVLSVSEGSITLNLGVSAVIAMFAATLLLLFYRKRRTNW